MFLCCRTSIWEPLSLDFSLNDPWMKDFQTSRTPTVLYDNYIIANPNMAYVGSRTTTKAMELAVYPFKKLGT